MHEKNKTLSQLQFSTCPETVRTNLTYHHFKKKKNKRITLKKYKTGRWDDKEHALFEYAFMKHGNDWKSVENIIKRRSAEQIRSHSQKFHIKLLKKYSVRRKNNKDLNYECEFDKKFVETFLKEEKRIFNIRKVHHSHEKVSCFIRKRHRKNVFVIEKENVKTKHSFYVEPEDNNLKQIVNYIPPKPDYFDNIKKELELFNKSNNMIIDLITSDFCQNEINFSYSFLTSNVLNCKLPELLGVSNSNEGVNTFNKFICDLIIIKKHI